MFNTRVCMKMERAIEGFVTGGGWTCNKTDIEVFV
jgi:hypothetical protein